MSPTARRLEREIRKLPAQDKIELHEHLIASIHEAEKELGLSPEWKAEITRRIDDIDSGRVKGVPVEVTYRKIKKRLT
jgi:putative addiction module component (TIGR02574 family)